MAEVKDFGDTSAVMERLTAASCTDNIERFEPKRNKPRKNLIVLSLLLAVVTPVVLWRSRGQPLFVVWRFSFLLCLISSFWTYFLTKTMGANVFHYNAFGFLLAFCADSALNPSIAVLTLPFTTHFAACLLGYALADHRQHEGSEKSAEHFRPRAKEEESTLLQIYILSGLLAFVAVPVILAGLAWLVWHAGEYSIETLIPMMLALLSMASVVGMCYVDMIKLRGCLISVLGFVFVYLYMLLVFAMHFFFALILGDVAAMVISWLACLGLPGFLGYSLSVYATFKEIKRVRELSELQNKRN